MNMFLEWLRSLLGAWKFWVVIPPWDIGVRIRFGRIADPLKPGPHWRIPFIDEIILVNTRQRSCSAPPITIQCDTNTVRVRSGMAFFRVTDPVIALMNFSQPDQIMAALLTAGLSRYATVAECLTDLRDKTQGKGIEIDEVSFVENAAMRSIRVIQGSGGIWTNMLPSNQESIRSY